MNDDEDIQPVRVKNKTQFFKGSLDGKQSPGDQAQRLELAEHRRDQKERSKNKRAAKVRANLRRI